MSDTSWDGWVIGKLCRERDEALKERDDALRIAEERRAVLEEHTGYLQPHFSLEKWQRLAFKQPFEWEEKS